VAFFGFLEAEIYERNTIDVSSWSSSFLIGFCMHNYELLAAANGTFEKG